MGSELASVMSVSIFTWINTAIISGAFHVYVGFPNVLYLFTVYKNVFLSWRRGTLRATATSKLDGRAYLTWIDDNLHMYHCPLLPAIIAA